MPLDMNDNVLKCESIPRHLEVVTVVIQQN